MFKLPILILRNKKIEVSISLVWNDRHSVLGSTMKKKITSDEIKSQVESILRRNISFISDITNEFNARLNAISDAHNTKSTEQFHGILEKRISGNGGTISFPPGSQLDEFSRTLHRLVSFYQKQLMKSPCFDVLDILRTDLLLAKTVRDFTFIMAAAEERGEATVRTKKSTRSKREKHNELAHKVLQEYRKYLKEEGSYKARKHSERRFAEFIGDKIESKASYKTIISIFRNRDRQKYPNYPWDKKEPAGKM